MAQLLRPTCICYASAKGMKAIYRIVPQRPERASLQVRACSAHKSCQLPRGYCSQQASGSCMKANCGLYPGGKVCQLTQLLTNVMSGGSGLGSVLTGISTHPHPAYSHGEKRDQAGISTASPETVGKYDLCKRPGLVFLG